MRREQRNTSSGHGAKLTIERLSTMKNEQHFTAGN